MNDSTNRGVSWAAVAVRLSGLWLLTGALAKLFLGTPKDLPDVVRNLSPFGSDLTFHLVIAVEFAIVWLALLKPRWAWPILLALFAFFEYVLGSQLAAGADSCGCFGSTIKVSPYLMVAIDGALLAFLLATRPWKTIHSSGLRIELVAVAIAITATLPWTVIGSQADPVTARYVDLEPGKWLNQSIFDIAELTRWVPADKLPTDGKLVIWRQGCDHCAAHLRKMAREDDGSQPIVLLQIRDDMANTREVDAMPNGAHVSTFALPENLEVPTITPWEVLIQGGVVTQALDQTHTDALDK